MEKSNKIKEKNLNFYSRQIGTFGLNTVKKLSKLNIIIFGLRGLGVEIAKNIILSGPNKVLLYDYHISKINDLNNNFYLQTDDINKKRLDEAVIENLKNLNDDVDVEILNSEEKLFESSKIDDDEKFFNFLQDFNVIIFSEICHSNIINKIENFCYENNKGFIYSGCLGLIGFIYNNFGKNFIVNEPLLNKQRIYYIKQIKKLDENFENNEKIIIKLLIEYENNMNNSLPLQKGDYVIFDEIEGLEFLNQKNTSEIFKIEKENDTTSFIINIYFEDINFFKKFNNYNYKKGGIIKEYIYPIKMNFQTLDKCIENPCFDSNIFNYPSNELNHSLFYSAQKYYDKYFSFPELNNESQVQIIVNEAKNFFDKKVNEQNEKDKNNEKDNEDPKSESDESSSYLEKEIDLNSGRFKPLFFNIKNFDIKKITNLSKWLKSQIPPVCSYFGGIVSQEIIKYTGKYIPNNQFYWYDFYDSVKAVAENDKINQSYKEINRYGDQIAIFGNKIQEIISQSNIFIIGAGAIGCEYLKNIALMGFSSSNENKIIITDNDNIEISNLNRQFLFNKENIGKSKSKCACLEAKKMNPFCNFEDKQLQLNSESENIFNTSFWKSQNYVLNAVDNIKARQYIDSQTTLFKIPLIETATEGLKAHCQIIIPFLTENYNEREYNKEEEDIDNTHSCTLKQFPFLIEHCIEWGKLKFEKYFNKNIENLKNIFIDIDKIINGLNKKTLKQKLNRLKKYIWYLDILEVYYEEKNEKKIIEMLMIKAIEIFYKLYYIKINNILNLYPIDFKLEDGNYFWSGTKRAPKALEYDINDKLSFEFMKSFIILLLKSFDINLSEYNILDNHFNESLKLIYNKKINDFSKNNAINSNKVINELNNNQNIDDINKNLIEEIKNNEIIFMEKLNLIKNKQWFKIECLIPTIFEKDDDSNYHIEFINSCSNLRARNYSIKECTNLDTKLISGKIIPAIVTTTSIIVGYACCLLLTLITNKLSFLIDNKEEDLKMYKNYNLNLFHELRFNLADNYFINSIPPKVKIINPSKIINVEYINYKKYKLMNKKNTKEEENDSKKNIKIKKYIKIIPKPEPFSKWDNLIINNSFSFNELKKYFKEKYQVNVKGIYTLQNKCLTSKKELFDTKIEIVYKNEIEDNKKEFILFNIDAETDNEDIIKFPIIKYNYL